MGSVLKGQVSGSKGDGPGLDPLVSHPWRRVSAMDRDTGGGRTLPACVAAVRHGWRPSKVPTATMRGLILWFSFRVKIGTSILAGTHGHASR